jgi:hypothetical protein
VFGAGEAVAGGKVLKQRKQQLKINPSSAVRPNGEKTFRGERLFVRVRFIGKRYCAGHAVPNTPYEIEEFFAILPGIFLRRKTKSGGVACKTQDGRAWHNLIRGNLMGFTVIADCPLCFPVALTHCSRTVFLRIAPTRTSPSPSAFAFLLFWVASCSCFWDFLSIFRGICLFFRL